MGTLLVRHSVGVVLILLSIGCAPDYGVAVRNLTSSLITDAHVTFGNFKSTGGAIDPGIYKITHEIGEPIPEEATVEWRTADGRLHVKRVAVKSVIPRNFSGRIFFEIMPDQTVRVRAREKLPAITTNADEP